MTPRQTALLSAIRAGHTTIRSLGSAAGIASTSVVKSELERLEAAGHIVLESTSAGERVYSGADYASAWDSAARLAGNPEA